MHFVYLDESGNTGNDLTNRDQPVFLLCAIIVPETSWLALEQDLTNLCYLHFPPNRVDLEEIHAQDLRNGKGPFAGWSVAQRMRFRDQWLQVAVKHQLRIIYRAIEKRRYRDWLANTFGPGVSVNPHVAAFALVAMVVNEYLQTQPGPPLGIFISDDNRQIVPDVEKSIAFLRTTVGKLRLTQIIEKGFFIDSRQSLPLQMCDVIALSLRKHEEGRFLKQPLKPFDEPAYGILEPLVYRGNEALTDVLAWLSENQKKERPGT